MSMKLISMPSMNDKEKIKVVLQILLDKIEDDVKGNSLSRSKNEKIKLLLGPDSYSSGYLLLVQYIRENYDIFNMYGFTLFHSHILYNGHLLQR